MKKISKSQLWHTLSVDQVLTQLDTTQEGLSESEVKRRRLRDGSNELKSHSISFWTIIANQFNNILIYILIVAFLISIGMPFLENPHPAWGDFSDPT